MFVWISSLISYCESNVHMFQDFTGRRRYEEHTGYRRARGFTLDWCQDEAFKKQLTVNHEDTSATCRSVSFLIHFICKVQSKQIQFSVCDAGSLITSLTLRYSSRGQFESVQFDLEFNEHDILMLHPGASPRSAPWGLSPAGGTRCSGCGRRALGGWWCSRTYTGASASRSRTPDLENTQSFYIFNATRFL